MEKFINLIICLLIGMVSLFIGAIFLKLQISVDLLNKLKILSYIIISFSLLLAIIQFRSNLKQNKKNADWNKKQITIQQLHSLRTSLSNNSEYLNNYLNTRREQPYSVREIHSLFGVIVKWNILTDKEKETLEKFFKGHIQNEDDIHNAGSEFKELKFIFYKKDIEEEVHNILKKIILSDKELEERKLNDIYYHQDWKNYDGKELHKKVHNFLGDYEYLGTGVNNDIFELKIVNELMGTGINMAYNTFSGYIKHLRTYHNPLNNNESTLYIQYEILTNAIKKERGEGN